MGRQLKADREKSLLGNPGRRRGAGEVPIDLITDPKPPKGMKRAHAAYWQRYAPYMIRAGLLTDLNVTDLRRLCSFEAACDAVMDFLTDNVPAMVQEKKNYHGDVVDLVESTYSKIARNYAASISRLKADLRIRTDKIGGIFRPTPAKSPEEEFLS